MKNNKELLSAIKDAVEFYNAKDFYSLDDAQQDKLLSILINDENIEIVLSAKANNLLSKYLLTSDRDDQIELMHEIRDCVKEQFSSELNDLIEEEISQRQSDIYFDAGF